jgi:methionyl-tRNA formyltransferase
LREPPATPSPDGAILLAGHGHGAHAAFDGLARVFSKIDLLGADDALAARTTGRCHDTLRTAPHDVVVMAGHRDIVPPDELARRVFINVHYSLLPKYRGLHSVVWAILNDEPELGCSVHLADAGIDSGPLLHQHAIPRPDGMTSHEAMERLNAHVAAELGHVVHRFLAGEIKPSPQDHAAATWVPRRNLDDCLIDFTETHRQLALFFDALVEPYPLPQIRCSAGRFEIVEHDLVARDYRTHLGRVVNVDAAGAWIKIREGLLVVKRLRPLGGATVDAAEVLRPGERLA